MRKVEQSVTVSGVQRSGSGIHRRGVAAGFTDLSRTVWLRQLVIRHQRLRGLGLEADSSADRGSRKCAVSEGSRITPSARTAQSIKTARGVRLPCVAGAGNGRTSRGGSSSPCEAGSLMTPRFTDIVFGHDLSCDTGPDHLLEGRP